MDILKASFLISRSGKQSYDFSQIKLGVCDRVILPKKYISGLVL